MDNTRDYARVSHSRRSNYNIHYVKFGERQWVISPDNEAMQTSGNIIDISHLFVAYQAKAHKQTGYTGENTLKNEKKNNFIISP